jgi:hypothetical protein
MAAVRAAGGSRQTRRILILLKAPGDPAVSLGGKCEGRSVTDQENRKSYPRHCPGCRTAMVGEKRDPASKHFDLYRCLNCGSIIEYGDKAADTHQRSPDEE